jgi:hypothetical protein
VKDEDAVFRPRDVIPFLERMGMFESKAELVTLLQDDPFVGSKRIKTVYQWSVALNLSIVSSQYYWQTSSTKKWKGLSIKQQETVWWEWFIALQVSSSFSQPFGSYALTNLHTKQWIE